MGAFQVWVQTPSKATDVFFSKKLNPRSLLSTGFFKVGIWAWFTQAKLLVSHSTKINKCKLHSETSINSMSRKHVSCNIITIVYNPIQYNNILYTMYSQQHRVCSITLSLVSRLNNLHKSQPCLRDPYTICYSPFVLYMKNLPVPTLT